MSRLPQSVRFRSLPLLLPPLQTARDIKNFYFFNTRMRMFVTSLGRSRRIPLEGYPKLH